MKLIVGLGNIGKEYENTRHNIGFMAIEEIAKFYNVSFTQKKFGGTYATFFYKNEKVMLLKPERFINLSGEVIKAFVDYFAIEIEDIFVIHDDLDMPVSKIKLRLKGSSGGHNGLKDIERNLKTSEYKRLKIGISNNKNIDTKDYVLGKFSNDDCEKIKEVLKIMPNIIEDYFSMSFDALMNKYNHK